MNELKEAREKLADYVSAHFDVLCYQELIKEDKGDKTMTIQGSGIGGGKVELREGQVNQELDSTEEASGRLMAIVDELEQQLSGVLHEATPPEDSAKEAESNLVPLARRIHNHYKGIRRQNARLQDIMDRLEIR